MRLNDFSLCVKKYTPSKLRGPNPLLWRYNRQARFNHHKKLFDLGIPVPVPYARLYEYDNQKCLIAKYTIFQKLEGAKTLGGHLGRYKGRVTLSMEENQQVFSRAGWVVASMHKCRYLHKDLNIHNILVKKKEVFLIDLDSVVRLPPVFPIRRRVVRELVYLLVSLNTRRRNEIEDLPISLFFAEYCKVFGVEPSLLLRDIWHRLDNIKSRRIKRGFKGKGLESVYRLVVHVAEFCNNISAK